MHTKILRESLSSQASATFTFFLFLAFMVLFSRVTLAADALGMQTATAAENPYKNVKAKLSVGGGFKPEYYEDAGWISRLGLSLTAPVGYGWSGSIRQRLEKSYREESDAYPSDLLVRLIRPQPFVTKVLAGVVSATLDNTLGISPASQAKHLQGASRLGIDSSLEVFGPLSLELGADGTKYYYRDTLSAAGVANTNYEVSAGIGLGVQLPLSMTLTVSTNFAEQTLFESDYRSYVAQVGPGAVHQYSFLNTVEMSIASLDRWLFSALMLTGDDQLEADGRRKPYVLYKRDLTQVRVALTRDL